jgi:hypothetical protein
MNMKLIIGMIVLCFALYCDRVAAYGSTETEEEYVRSGKANPAVLTSAQEGLERSGNLNDAYITGREEEMERFNFSNNALATSTQEEASRH